MKQERYRSCQPKRSGALTTNVQGGWGHKKIKHATKEVDPPSLPLEAQLETDMPHAYRIECMVDRTLYVSDFRLCVSSLRTVQQRTPKYGSQCKDIRVTCCSCRLKVSLLKQKTHKTSNHFWLNPQLPHNHHNPNAQRRNARNARRRERESD